MAQEVVCAAIDDLLTCFVQMYVYDTSRFGKYKDR